MVGLLVRVGKAKLLVLLRNLLLLRALLRELLRLLLLWVGKLLLLLLVGEHLRLLTGKRVLLLLLLLLERKLRRRLWVLLLELPKLLLLLLVLLLLKRQLLRGQWRLRLLLLRVELLELARWLLLWLSLIRVLRLVSHRELRLLLLHGLREVVCEADGAVGRLVLGRPLRVGIWRKRPHEHAVVRVARGVLRRPRLSPHPCMVFCQRGHRHQRRHGQERPPELHYSGRCWSGASHAFKSYTQRPQPTQSFHETTGTCDDVHTL